VNSVVLVTGGAGYIGSHTVLALLEAGYDVVVLDNLCNSTDESLRRVQILAGRAPHFVLGDVRNAALLDAIFKTHRIFAVFHFAGLKSVAESSMQPLAYYQNNVAGTFELCQAMARAGVHKFIFSSSATVYGDPVLVPISEDAPTGSPTNPYGRSKLMAEEFLRDLGKSDLSWRIGVLRYFNPIGAHPSGLIGEDSRGIPNNLLPYISQVATGRFKVLKVFGGDYPTPDGTGMRDYIHVQDLASGHLEALRVIDTKPGVNVWNLGAGRSYSVLEMIRAFELASGRSIPWEITARRPGDIAACWADAAKASVELNWRAKRGLCDMMDDAWRWQSKNPDGYSSVVEPGNGRAP